MTDPGAWDYAPLLYYDMVVRGVVDQTEIVKVDTGDIWMSPTRSGSEAALLRVTLKTTRILRGPRVDEKFSFLCAGDTREASSFFLDGREVLVCGKYNNKIGIYCQSSRYGRYWNDAGIWKSDLTPRGAREFSDAQLAEKIHGARASKCCRRGGSK